MRIELNNYDTSFEHLFNIFITSSKAKGLSVKTLSSYQSHFKSISKYLDITSPVEDYSSSNLELLISEMRSSELSANTIQSYLRVLAAFFSWCRKNGYSDLRIPQYKGEETIKETYSDNELALLLKKPNLKSCSFEEYRNWVIINLLLDCGCRSATIRAIENRDIDLDKGLICYRHTKNRKVQVLPLCSTMCAILREYTRIRKGKPEDKLFCTIEGLPLTENALKSAIRKYNLKRGVQKTSVHLFRHTFSRKFLLDCNGDPFTLQRILGHSTLSMTMHYCNLYNSDLLSKFDEISPLAKLSNNGRINIKNSKR